MCTWIQGFVMGDGCGNDVLQSVLYHYCITVTLPRTRLFCFLHCFANQREQGNRGFFECRNISFEISTYLGLFRWRIRCISITWTLFGFWRLTFDFRGILLFLLWLLILTFAEIGGEIFTQDLKDPTIFPFLNFARYEIQTLAMILLYCLQYLITHNAPHT